MIVAEAFRPFSLAGADALAHGHRTEALSHVLSRTIRHDFALARDRESLGYTHARPGTLVHR
jgi:hypothetical protein